MALKEAYEKVGEHKLLIWILIVFAVVLVLIALLLSYLVFTYPVNQVSQYGITNATEKANLINQYRTTSIQLISIFAQIFGGIAFLIGIYFAWGNLKVSQATLESNQKNAEKNLEVALANLKSDQKTAQKNIEISLATLDSNIKNAQESLGLAQESQITERFTRAVDQLGANDQSGNPATEIRLGGIYALERIANESEKDYWPIMEILTAYVRKNSSNENPKFAYTDFCVRFKRLVPEIINIVPEIKDTQLSETQKTEFSSLKDLPSDIQAILTVLGRRKYKYKNGENKSLSLSKTNLERADLSEAHIEGANLSTANLMGANLMQAHLNEAYLTDAYLSFAVLSGAHIEEANFTNAHLEGAFFMFVQSKRTYFMDANLSGARLGYANLLEVFLDRANLKGANIIKANLTGAYLIRTNLEGADLAEANLEGAFIYEAILKGAKNLTVDQLSKAKTLYKTELDKGLEKELRAKGFGHLLDDEPER